jgi:hypothetical protein
VGSSINMLTCSESNNLSKEHPKVTNRDGGRHVDASSGEAQVGGGDEDEFIINLEI